jgi:hypothetical protein
MNRKDSEMKTRTMLIGLLMAFGANAFAYDKSMVPNVEKILAWADSNAPGNLNLPGKEDTGILCVLSISNRRSGEYKDVFFTVIELSQSKADGTINRSFTPDGLLSALRVQYNSNGTINPDSWISDHIEEVRTTSNSFTIRTVLPGHRNEEIHVFDIELTIILNNKNQPIKAIAIDHSNQVTKVCNLSPAKNQ